MDRSATRISVVLVMAICMSPLMSHGSNSYEKAIVGSWEIEDEADLFVFKDDNVCYRMDEDGIKTSEKGRWSATSSKLTIEVKYNGKKYRTVFEYTMVDKDNFNLVIKKVLVDGKIKKAKKKQIKTKRWKE